MKQIEIPYVKDRDRLYRFFEMLPGFISWGILATPIILSFINPTYAAYFIIAYLLMWFLKTMVMNVRMAQGYRKLNFNMSLDWYEHAVELNDPDGTLEKYPEGVSPAWHYRNLIRHKSRMGDRARLPEIEHVAIIAVVNESKDIVGPTLEGVVNSNYPMDKMTVVIALEERSGPEQLKLMQELKDEYGHNFKHMEITVHPRKPNEVIGKGGNITYAGRWVNEYYTKKKINPKHVIVTTLDSDNRPHPQYFAAAAYAYLACPDPIKASFQPIAVFTNNIWDVPAPMRVVATANSFWNIVQSLRPHMIRNFAAHSQTLKTLQDTDFWSVRTIVEDGHQFWRTYLRYNGKNEVYPILLPIYQDAVLSHSYMKTLRAQFVQIRRWAWGASDIAYVLNNGWRNNKKQVPKVDLFFKTARLFESHTSWATAPLVILLGAWVPLYIAPEAGESFVANQLPIIASWIQRVAMVGLFLSIYLSIRLLPPKPPHYKNHFWVFMILQWMLLPLITIGYSATSALNSQTRLIFGKYLGKFDLTEKVVKKADGTRK